MCIYTHIYKLTETRTFLTLEHFVLFLFLLWDLVLKCLLTKMLCNYNNLVSLSVLPPFHSNREKCISKWITLFVAKT